MRTACACGVAAVLLAAFFSSLPYALTFVPLPATESTNLSSPTYDIKPVSAPAASGIFLRLLARVLTSPIGTLVARILLNDNELWRLRELSLLVPESVPHQPMPFHRLSRDQRAAHAKLSKAKGADATSANAATSRAKPTGHSIRWSVRDYHAAYVAGRTTPTAVARALLESVRELEPVVGTIFTEVQPVQVLEQAAASARRYAAGTPISVWDGVPIGVKEMIDVVDHVTGDGSWRGTDGAPSRDRALRDDPMVARMREAGAVIAGITSMTEYGVTPLGWSAHAQGPRNPHNRSHFSGGSSSGSAVAVALGLVPMAIGFDGGGSIRIPAALSGVYGLAATFGRIAFHTSALGSMTHAGPLAATLADAALSYVWLAGSAPPSTPHTTSHAYGGDGPPPAHIHGWDRKQPVAGSRIGIFRAWWDDAAPEVVEASDAALATLTAKGATLVPIAIPNLRTLSLAHGIAISAEFSWAHDRELTSGWPLEPSTAIQLVLGRVLSGVEVHAANRLRAWGMTALEATFREHQLDAIITPTTSITAPPLHESALAHGLSDTSLVMSLMRHIFLANLLGLPAISVPVGVGHETGLPVGVQLIGAWWGEADLLRIASALDADAAIPRPAPSHFEVLDALLGRRGDKL